MWYDDFSWEKFVHDKIDRLPVNRSDVLYYQNANVEIFNLTIADLSNPNTAHHLFVQMSIYYKSIFIVLEWVL